MFFRLEGRILQVFGYVLKITLLHYTDISCFHVINKPQFSNSRFATSNGQWPSLPDRSLRTGDFIASCQTLALRLCELSET